MNPKPAIAAALVVTILLSMAVGTRVSAVTADSSSLLSMPEEYINYTITSINGILWAKIDGIYPIHYFGSETTLPMVYPTPPNTTNIHLWLDDVELNWSNYPEVLHHTGIGDWEMVFSVLEPVPEDFVLRIHYEHPVQVINGSYMFLYDLNIAQYLSPSANKSLAHFTVFMDVNFSDLSVDTLSVSDEALKPIDYTVSEENPARIELTMVSECDKPLLGDLLFSFKTADSQETVDSADSFRFYVLVTVAVLALAGIAAFLFLRRTRRKIGMPPSIA